MSGGGGYSPVDRDHPPRLVDLVLLGAFPEEVRQRLREGVVAEEALLEALFRIDSRGSCVRRRNKNQYMFMWVCPLVGFLGGNIKKLVHGLRDEGVMARPCCVVRGTRPRPIIPTPRSMHKGYKSIGEIYQHSDEPAHQNSAVRTHGPREQLFNLPVI